MRNITIKSTTSENKRRRHLSMTELIKDNGLIARAEKHYSFYIAEKREAIPAEELHTWISSHNKIQEKKARNVCVRRTYDKESGLGRTMYRTTGSFYVIKQYRVYVIVFVHSVKFDILDPGSFHY